MYNYYLRKPDNLYLKVSTLKIKKICFSPKVSILPCRPKSDSALPGAIWAQFWPKKAQSKGYSSPR